MSQVPTSFQQVPNPELCRSGARPTRTRCPWSCPSAGSRRHRAAHRRPARAIAPAGRRGSPGLAPGQTRLPHSSTLLPQTIQLHAVRLLAYSCVVVADLSSHSLQRPDALRFSYLSRWTQSRFACSLCCDMSTSPSYCEVIAEPRGDSRQVPTAACTAAPTSLPRRATARRRPLYARVRCWPSMRPHWPCFDPCIMETPCVVLMFISSGHLGDLARVGLLVICGSARMRSFIKRRCSL